MKQLVILSGKGGTGKTSIAAAFAHLAHADSLRAVLADADVDAANLELVLSPRVSEEHDFVGGSVAVIDPDLCNNCGVCIKSAALTPFRLVTTLTRLRAMVVPRASINARRTRFGWNRK